MKLRTLKTILGLSVTSEMLPVRTALTMVVFKLLIHTLEQILTYNGCCKAMVYTLKTILTSNN